MIICDIIEQGQIVKFLTISYFRKPPDDSFEIRVSESKVISSITTIIIIIIICGFYVWILLYVSVQ